MLRFNGDTTIKLKEENPSIPKYYFNFEQFEAIGDTIKDPKAVVDHSHVLLFLIPLTMASIQEAQNVRCVATFTGFDHPEGWCYVGLAAFITDEADHEADIIMFDKQAQSLCGHTATELISLPDNTRHEVPYVFVPAVGQNYSFVLKYNRGTEQGKHPMFNVNDLMPMTDSTFTQDTSTQGSASSRITGRTTGTITIQSPGAQSNLPPKTPSKSTDPKKSESSRGKALATKKMKL